MDKGVFRTELQIHFSIIRKSEKNPDLIIISGASGEKVVFYPHHHVSLENHGQLSRFVISGAM